MNDTLRSHLDRIRGAALKAADPAFALERHLHLHMDGSQATLTGGQASWILSEGEKVHLLAVGKAAVPMAQRSLEILGARLAAGFVIAPHEQAATRKLPRELRLLEAGHPIPDRSGLEAAEEVERFLRGMRPGNKLIILLSGGASALLAAPAPDISLDELQAATQLLLRSGATIQDLNAIRKHMDRLKGGQLVRLARAVPIMTLILSDVIGDRLDIIASGPTVPDPSTYSECWGILERYRLVGRMPAGIVKNLKSGVEGRLPETPKPGDAIFKNVSNTIIGSNRLAADAALAEASRLGYNSLLLSTFSEGEARDLGVQAAAIGKGLHYRDTPIPRPACIVAGGETTVTVTGKGKGGRNQELALSAAIWLEGVPDTALMAFATDGIDGPTDAAGAIVDGETVATARRAGLDAQSHLADNDAYALLKVAGALIFSGPTNTNVNDLLVILAG